MNKRIFNRNKSNLGFGIIEVLVTLLIISFGLIALSRMEIGLFSSVSGSKARTEATAIAQAQIEAFRSNRKIEGLSGGDASDWYRNFESSTTSVTGSNAVYTIVYSLSGTKKSTDATTGAVTTTENFPLSTNSASPTILDPDLDEITKINLEVEVSWDADDDLPVSMVGSITYLRDDIFIDIVNSLKSSGFITAPTGRAKIGAGELSDSEKEILTDKDYEGREDRVKDDGHKDGVTVFERDNGDIVLVQYDDTDEENPTTTGKILLTLEEACVSTSCTQFTTLRGTFFIEENSTLPTHTDPSGFAPADAVDESDSKFFLIASDAAYCTFYYDDRKFDGTGILSNAAGYVLDTTYDLLDDSVGTSIPIINPLVTENGQYQFLDYVCYVGSGWYGNIGIVFPKSTGSISDEVFCLGDPDVGTSTPDLDMPVITIRRAYRALMYKVNGSGAPDLDASGNKQYRDLGIQDDIHYTHQDIVLTKIRSRDGLDCFTDGTVDASGDYVPDVDLPLSQPDSENGKLFVNMPNDFVCLNENHDGLEKEIAFDDAYGKTVAEPRAAFGDGSIDCKQGPPAGADLGTSNCISMDYDLFNEDILKGTYVAETSCSYDLTQAILQDTVTYTVTISGYDLTNTDASNLPVQIKSSSDNRLCDYDSKTITDTDIGSLVFRCRVFYFDDIDVVDDMWTESFEILPVADLPDTAPSADNLTCTPSIENRTGSSATTEVGVFTCTTGEKVNISGAIKSESNSKIYITQISLSSSSGSVACNLIDTLGIPANPATTYAAGFECNNFPYNEGDGDFEMTVVGYGSKIGTGGGESDLNEVFCPVILTDIDPDDVSASMGDIDYENTNTVKIAIEDVTAAFSGNLDIKLHTNLSKCSTL